MKPVHPVFLAAGALVSCLVGASAAEIDASDLYKLPPADVIFLGEVHDNPIHHAHQAIALEALGAKAIVYEMLTPDQARLVPGADGSEAALESALGWNASGWPDFALYYPVFVAGADAVVLGGARNKAAVRRAVTEGAAAVYGEGADVFGLDLPLDVAEQRLRVAGQADAHCGALPEDLLPGMVEAQRLRDAELARAIVEAALTIGRPVAVITGNGHARRDWGAPRMVLRAMPDLTVLSVGQFESEPGPDTPFDLWLVTEGAERGDPCAAFDRP